MMLPAATRVANRFEANSMEVVQQPEMWHGL